MNIRCLYVLIPIFSVHILAITDQELPIPVIRYLDVKSRMNFGSDELLTRYLPERLSALIRIIHTQSLEQVTQSIINDPDRDSYFFILEAEPPYEFIAYSRHPNWSNKTPTELQKLFSEHGTPPDVPALVKQLISTANQATLFIPYLWYPNVVGTRQQIAYITRVLYNDTAYIVGVATYVTRSFEHIILPFNTDVMINRIKQDGFDAVIQSIVENKDPERYFVIINATYPYRYVVNPRAPITKNMTPQELQYYDDPTKQDETYNYFKRVTELLRVAKHGGGYNAYITRTKSKGPLALRVTYTKVFEYKKKKYIIATGYYPQISTDHIHQLQNRTNNTVQLIKKIGISNAISTLKKSADFIYIYNATTQIVTYHPNPHYNNQSCSTVQAYLEKTSKTKGLNLCASLAVTTEQARAGGGFCAFTFLEDIPQHQKALVLKVAYIKPFEYKDQFYWIAAGLKSD